MSFSFYGTERQQVLLWIKYGVHVPVFCSFNLGFLDPSILRNKPKQMSLALPWAVCTGQEWAIKEVERRELSVSPQRKWVIEPLSLLLETKWSLSCTESYKEQKMKEYYNETNCLGIFQYYSAQAREIISSYSGGHSIVWQGWNNVKCIHRVDLTSRNNKLGLWKC